MRRALAAPGSSESQRLESIASVDGMSDDVYQEVRVGAAPEVEAAPETHMRELHSHSGNTNFGQPLIYG